MFILFFVLYLHRKNTTETIIYNIMKTFKDKIKEVKEFLKGKKLIIEVEGQKVVCNSLKLFVEIGTLM